MKQSSEKNTKDDDEHEYMKSEETKKKEKNWEFIQIIKAQLSMNFIARSIFQKKKNEKKNEYSFQVI